MFEIIKAYRNLREMDGLAKGAKTIFATTGDREGERNADEALFMNAKLRKTLWHRPIAARKFNHELDKYRNLEI